MTGRTSVTIQTFIPSGDIPPTRFAGISSMRWMSPDTEERYRSNPHPVYGPEDIVYRFNSRGYRAPEADAEGDVKVLVIGCSWSFGMGLPAEHGYVEVLRRMLAEELGRSVTCWNLSMPGHSNDFISRTLMASLPVLDPDLVFVQLTKPGRREYFTADGQQLNVLPRVHETRGLDRVRKQVMKLHRGLASDMEDQLNMLKNYKLVELTLAQRGTPWFFTALGTQDLRPIEYLLDQDRFVGFSIYKQDLARDAMHPGPESNSVFAERLLPILVEPLRERAGGGQPAGAPSAESSRFGGSADSPS